MPVFESSLTRAARRLLSLRRRCGTLRMNVLPGLRAARTAIVGTMSGTSSMEAVKSPGASLPPDTSIHWSVAATPQPSSLRKRRKRTSPWWVQKFVFATRTVPPQRAAARKK